MITQTIPTWQVADWKQELRRMVSSYHELLHLLDLGDSPLAAMDFPGFPLRVPRTYIARMEKGNPDDPLLKR